jgi:hypothetical protein
MQDNLEINDIIKNIETNLIMNPCENIMKEKVWKKNCPKCGDELNYSSHRGLVFSISHNSLCRKCSKLGSKNPSFNKVGVWKGLVGPNKGKTFGIDFKLKMSKIVKGRKHTKESKIKMSLSNIGKNIWSKGKVVSNITKEKLRLKRIEDLRKKGIFPGSKFSKNYNVVACKFIEDFGKKNGYNFQHALNGGEIEVCGYFVDGYDKEKNIVFEYDEKHHYKSGTLRNLDKIKETEIINKINPNMFIRYDEQKNLLIDVISGKEIL